MYNKCFKIHILKQQAGDVKLVFILMEIINFKVRCILNAIYKRMQYIRGKRFYDAYYIKLYSHIFISYIYPKFQQIRGFLFV